MALSKQKKQANYMSKVNGIISRAGFVMVIIGFVIVDLLILKMLWGNYMCVGVWLMGNGAVLAGLFSDLLNSKTDKKIDSDDLRTRERLAVPGSAGHRLVGHLQYKLGNDDAAVVRYIKTMGLSEIIEVMSKKL